LSQEKGGWSKKGATVQLGIKVLTEMENRTSRYTGRDAVPNRTPRSEGRDRATRDRSAATAPVQRGASLRVAGKSCQNGGGGASLRRAASFVRFGHRDECGSRSVVDSPAGCERSGCGVYGTLSFIPSFEAGWKGFGFGGLVSGIVEPVAQLKLAQ
jgi:hypothetical protein